jgi:flagella basal body P-ring formation protein FlgA
MGYRITRHLLPAVALTLAMPLGAETSASLAEIRQAAEQFALEQVNDTGLSNIQVKAAELDPRLKLASCDGPLETFSSSRSRQLARTTVGVRCNGQKPWTLYVPVAISALANSVFTARPVLRGEALSPESLEIRQVPVDKLPLNYLSSPEQALGMEASRPLKADSPLTLNALRTRQLVKQGQEVLVIASSGGIQVRMSGTALKSGSLGDLIQVRNANSGRTIEAEILDSGTVRVNF